MYDSLRDVAGRFFASEQPETRRVFHGRGHLFPGLEHVCVDWFAPVVLVTSYEDIDDPEALAAAILARDVHGQIKTLLLQYRNRKGAPVTCLHGEPMNYCVVKEGDLKFEVQPGVNQNAGLFLDMRPLREWLVNYSAGRNVLNLFAYTCTLSVAALAGNARQVCSVDMSKPSILWGQRNHDLNAQNPRAVKSIPHNLFRSWGRIQQFGRYDTVIIDPPSRQRGSFDAEKNYGAVLKKLGKLVNPEADIIATVNSPYLGEDFLPHQFQRYAPKYRLVGMMPASPEFADKYPERGLKIYHYRA